MRRFAVLTGLEIKKSMCTFPKLLVGAVLVFIIVLAVGYTAEGILNEKPELTEEMRPKLGIVCRDDSWIMEQARAAITSLKSVKNSVSIVFEEDEETAMERMKEGGYMAVIVIPENAVKDIMSGKNTPMQIYFPPNAGYEAAALAEVADAAVRMLASAQAGVYSVYDFYQENYRDRYIDEALDRLNERYIKTVLLRERFFENNTVVATGDLDVMDYYIISGIVFFLFLFGMNSLAFMQDYRPEITALLKQNGIGAGRQVLARFAGIFCMYVAIQSILTAAIRLSGGVSTAAALKLLAAMLPVSCAAASVVLLLQVYVKHKSSAVILMFLLAVFQGFVTGGFIPQIMLPQAVASVGRLTPAYYMIRQFKIVYLEGDGLAANSAILLIITASVLAACAAKKRYGRGMGADI